jgi:sugar phosphate isomerase/epimerase
MAEQNYEFRRRLNVVHKPDRRDFMAIKAADECEIGEGWIIAMAKQPSEYLLNVAQDLQQYLLVSMNIPVLLHLTDDVKSAAGAARKAIILATCAQLELTGAQPDVPRSYRFEVSADRITICGFDERGIGQGCYYFEDLLNLREAPFVKLTNMVRKPLFSPRMTHSGWGLDHFPDEHLNAIAHAGMDSIMIFTKEVNMTPVGFVDFNDLIERAAKYGLDVYAYSYIRSLFHPDDPRAQSYYDSTYGTLFSWCPKLKGVILVGESCGFPSKDPRTSGELRKNSPAAQKSEKYEKLVGETKADPFAGENPKPNPGWWPCVDFPELLTMIRDTVHRRAPEAEIVFWTYNWGWAPEADRVALIRHLPVRITLMATFEMFQQLHKDGITNQCVDYTIAFEGPGAYFASEAKAARERGIRLYTMSNTGGRTWDIGVIPYLPVPFQWDCRHQAMRRVNEDWGLSGLMESHHYGWWPSFISELAKWAFWSPHPPVEQVTRAIADRDFGPAAAPHMLEAWRQWSDAFRDFVPAREDQSGPGRIGPSYPLVFRSAPQFPAADYAMNGTRIFGTTYQPPVNDRQSPGTLRYNVEIRRMTSVAARWLDGVNNVREAIGKMPEEKRVHGERMLGLGIYILCAIRTALHAKKWYQFKAKLFASTEVEESLHLLDELERLARQEIANAEEAIPWAEADSCLGWEPSMEYVADAKHIRWKIRQVETMIRQELAIYRDSIVKLTDSNV